MKEIELNKQLPVITFNFDEVKASLEEGLSKYENLVVTDENLKDCKATQKDLSKLRRELDTYRKDTKKEMEKPIKEFEGQCKELVGLIDKVEKPIKNNIEVYDNKKREEKRLYAERYINKLIINNQLIPKFADQLTVLPKYMNLTASKKSVTEDLDQRAAVLKTQQVAEKAMLENKKVSIQSAIENENKTCPVPLQYEDYVKHIEDWELKTILSFIHRDAEKLREAEIIAKEKAKAEAEKKLAEEQSKKLDTAKEVEEEVKTKEEIQMPVDLGQRTAPTKLEEKEPQYFVVMKAQGTMEQIQELSHFLKENNYKYEAIQKGKVK